MEGKGKTAQWEAKWRIKYQADHIGYRTLTVAEWRAERQAPLNRGEPSELPKP